MLCDVDDGKIRSAECCLQQIDCRTLNALGTVCNVYKANPSLRGWLFKDCSASCCYFPFLVC